jgi:maleamate amidohydrolase
MTGPVETFGGSLGWGQRPALLLIDMMRAYFTPGSPFDLGSDAAVIGCGTLLAAARAAGLPVVHTRVRYRPGASDGGLFVRKVGALRLLAEDVPGDLGEFAAGLEPRPDEVVIVKQYANIADLQAKYADIATIAEATARFAGI